MKITTVRYERLRSFGNYENETVAATAQVEDGETPESALAALRQWVEAQLGEVEKLSQMRQRYDQLDWEVHAMEQRLRGAKSAYERVKAILERHGVELRDDDLPF